MRALEDCGLAESASADEYLEAVLRRIKAIHADDPVFLEALAVNQKAWESYRDSQLHLRFPAADPRVEYGSIYGMCVTGIRQQMTEKRIDELGLWLNGVQEGNVCGGSVIGGENVRH